MLQQFYNVMVRAVVIFMMEMTAVMIPVVMAMTAMKTMRTMSMMMRMMTTADDDSMHGRRFSAQAAF